MKSIIYVYIDGKQSSLCIHIRRNRVDSSIVCYAIYLGFQEINVVDDLNDAKEIITNVLVNDGHVDSINQIKFE